eukprot:2623711-Prymnesium_polylepis.1
MLARAPGRGSAEAQPRREPHGAGRLKREGLEAMKKRTAQGRGGQRQWAVPGARGRVLGLDVRVVRSLSDSLAGRRA